MPKIVDRDQYRQELLGQCLAVIADRGYAAITMRQIAQGLGVSTGTLYHYFPSKENLFEQLVEYISYQDTSEEAIAQFKSYPTRAERLEAIFNSIGQQEDYFLHQTLMLIDFGRQQERSEINDHETLKRAGERYEKALMQVLEVDDPELVILIINMIDGLLLRRVYQGDRISVTRQAQIFKDMLMAYLKSHDQLAA